MSDRQSFEELLRERIQNRPPGPGFDVRNQDGDGPVELRIWDVIGWPYIEARDIAEQLDQIDADEILVSINSPGGSVFESIAIFNALRQHPARIVTRVDSLAASGASIVAQAGDHRIMVTASQMMIHNAWALAIGDAAAMRKTADLLAKQDTNLAAIYADRSGRPRSDFIDMMTEETWFLADEAVGAGLADEVADPAAGDGGAEARGTRLIDHIAAVADDVDKITERVAEVASLRSEQGKSLDGSWRTRGDVDRLESSLSRLVEALSPDEDGGAAGREEPETNETDSGLEMEYLRFVSDLMGDNDEQLSRAN